MKIDLNISDDVKTIMKLIPDSKLCGGCVRDFLLSETPKDIDIATSTLPDDVIQICNDNNIKVIPTGYAHGTVTALINDTSIEITTLRNDVSTDGRRATVAFTTSWVEDSQRRDFTFNALYCDSDGNILDPTGQGISDLNKGIVRFVGNPSKRITEDYLRVLRYIRFSIKYGCGQVDKESFRAFVKFFPDIIGKVSQERIFDETFKILNLSNSVSFYKFLRRFSKIDGRKYGDTIISISPLFQFHPIYSTNELMRLIKLEINKDIPVSKLARFFVFFDGFWTNGSNLAAIKLDRSILKAFSHYLKAFTDNVVNNDLWNRRKLTTVSNNIISNLLWKCGDRELVKTILIALSVHPSFLLLYKTFETNMNDLPIPEFPLKGQDLIDNFNVKEGKQIGVMLDFAKDHWTQTFEYAMGDDVKNALLTLVKIKYK